MQVLFPDLLAVAPVVAVNAVTHAEAPGDAGEAAAVWAALRDRTLGPVYNERKRTGDTFNKVLSHIQNTALIKTTTRITLL